MSVGRRTGRLEFVFPPEARQLRPLRQQLRRKLDELDVSRGVADSVLLVVDEIVSNAVEHADDYRLRGGKVALRLERRGQRLWLEFEDPDVPASVVRELARVLTQGGRPVDPTAERGRGLLLVAENVDSLRVEAGPRGGMRLRGLIPETA